MPAARDVLERRERALDAVEAALLAVEPAGVTRAGLGELAARGIELDGCVVFGFGKASRAMAEAVVEQVRPRAGLVLGFEEGRLGPLRLLRGDHPVPRHDAAERGREVLELARSLGAGDVALCLVSGGGSAMLEVPGPGWTLEAIRRRTVELLRRDVDIGQLNRERARMSCLKGGGGGGGGGGGPPARAGPGAQPGDLRRAGLRPRSGGVGADRGPGGHHPGDRGQRHRADGGSPVAGGRA